MNRTIAWLMLLSLLLSACGGNPTPASTSAPTSTAQPSPTSTVTPSATPLPTATPTLAPTLTPSATPLPPLALKGTPPPAPTALISAQTADRLRELARWGKGRAEEVEFSGGGHWLMVKTSLETHLYDAKSLAAGPVIEGSLQFAPGGKLAAAVTTNGEIDLWQVEGWKLLYSVRGGRLAFSPDGSLLAVTTTGDVRLIDAATGKTLLTLPAANAGRLQFTRDGTAVIVSTPKFLQVWQAGDGQPLKNFEYEQVNRAALVKDGSLLLVQARSTQNEAVIDIYQTQDWTRVGSIEVSGAFVTTPDGERVYIYSNYPTPGLVRVFSLPDGKALGENRLGGSIYRLTAAPDSRLVAASILEYSPALLQTSGYLKMLDGKGNVVRRLDCGSYCEAQAPLFSPDGKVLAAAGLVAGGGINVGATYLFDVQRGERLRVLRGPKVIPGAVEKLAFSPDGATLVTLNGRYDDAVRVWKTADGALQQTFEWGAETLYLGDLAPDGKSLAVFSDAGLSQVVDIHTGAVLSSWNKTIEPRFSRSGEWLALAEAATGRQEGLRLFKTGGGEALTTFPRAVSGPLAFSPVEDIAALVNNFSAQLIGLPAGKFIASFSANGRPNVKLVSARFSPDGKLLAAGSANGEVFVWNIAEKKQVAILEGLKDSVHELLFTPGGAQILGAAVDGNLRLWQISDGKVLQTINTADLVRRAPGAEEATFGQLAGLALSPDGKLIAASGYLNPLQPAPARAGVVLLIRAADGSLLHTLRGGGGTLAFSADGQWLFTGGDGALHQWGVLP